MYMVVKHPFNDANYAHLIGRVFDVAPSYAAVSPVIWGHCSTDGQITIYEGATAFWIVDNATGEERCMGDGVDMFFNEEGGSLWVDTPEFYAALATLADDLETREAYFGD